MTSTKAPKHLGREGRRFYRELLHDYQIDDVAGVALVTRAAEALDRLREAQKLIAEHGVATQTAAGGLKSNPALRAEHDARSGFLAAMRALNLDVIPPNARPGKPAGTFPRG